MTFDLLIKNFPITMALSMTFLGACFGSFAGVIIYRIPEGLSIVLPQSFCSSCKLRLKPWHNIPIFSWLFLRGRCAYCQESLGIRHLIVEVLFALCLLALYIQAGLSLTLIEKFGFCFLLISLAYIDLDTYYLPLNLLFILCLWGLFFSFIYYFYPESFRPSSEPFSFLRNMVLKPFGAFSLSDRLYGALAGLLSFSLINVAASLFLRRSNRLSKEQWAMGWGDPLLLMAIGLFVGLSHLLVVIFVASFLGSVVGIVLKLSGRVAATSHEIAHDAVPFGPFLAIAAIYVYVF
jgi:leader peptidase (prepilin peptidase)/N-methyltransferase